MNLSKSYEYFQPDKVNERIHIIGCGSVGATIAENLARSGITKMTLWDFDRVEPHNLSNQIFRERDIGESKVDALLNIVKEINPDIVSSIKIQPDGWQGAQLSGFVFLCVDNIETRKRVVEMHMDNPYIKAMFDFRTRLEDAQHYAADWSNRKMKEDFLKSMNFSHLEATNETPMSACNIALSVCPTVRIICAYGVANFMNLCNKRPIKRLIIVDAFNFMLDSF